MKRYRTLLSVLLGLVLLVQGVAVSAAPYSMLFGSEPAVATMDSDMPCHGQMDDRIANDPATCCNADCPDMSSCMLIHLAIHARFQLNADHSPDAVPHLVPARVISQFPPSLLRPPISLHG